MSPDFSQASLCFVLLTQIQVLAVITNLILTLTVSQCDDLEFYMGIDSGVWNSDSSWDRNPATAIDLFLEIR